MNKISLEDSLEIRPGVLFRESREEAVSGRHRLGGLLIAAAFQRAQGMSWQEWRLLLEAGRLAVFTEVALRVSPFNKLLARLDAADARVPIAAASCCSACEHAVDLAYRVLRPLTRTCLKESLVLLRMLKGRGVSVRFCLGVRKDGDRLAAHAWIEQDGTPLAWTDKSYALLPIPNSSELVSR